MTKWYEPGRWLLIAAVAAHLTGCAQTSQWVGRVTGRDRATEDVAEVDGRDEALSKQKEKVKIASDSNGSKKKSKASKYDAPDEPKIAKKSQTKSGEEPSRNEIAQASKSDRRHADTFEDETDELPIRRKSRTRDEDQVASADEDGTWPAKRGSILSLPKNPFGGRAQVADESSSQADTDEIEVREVALTTEEEAPVEEAGEIAAASAVAGDSVTRKLSKLKPSQASYTQLCPAAEGDVRELVRSLDDENLEHVKRSLHRLGRLGPDAASALPVLDHFLTHTDGYVRVHAALAMCRIDGVSPIALDTLTGALKATDPGLRSFAAAVIAELGPQSSEATPALATALEDPDAYVRLHVAEVLIRYDDWSETSLDTLLDCLRHRDENVRWLTAYSLAELAPQSPAAVNALVVRLEDDSTKVRIGAVYALGEIGTLAEAALPDLQRHGQDANAELRAAVTYALDQIQNSAKQEE